MTAHPPTRRPARALRSVAALCVLAGLAGCATAPADPAAALSRQDPKWSSPDCARARLAAERWEAGRKAPLSWAGGALLGPYGLAIAAAGKEHQARERRRLARDTHLACASTPLPRHLQAADRPPDPPPAPR